MVMECLCSFLHHIIWSKTLFHMLTTLKTPKTIFCGNNNIMQSGNCKQDHPGQENYKQPYKVIYPKLFTMALFTA